MHNDETSFDAFLFYRSFRESINDMTNKDQLATLLAIIDYALYGVEPKLSGKMPSAVFTVARPIIDANNARRSGGKKGGRPKRKTIGFSSDETIGFDSGETIGFQNEKPDALYNEDMNNEKMKHEKQRNEERRNEKDCGGDGDILSPSLACAREDAGEQDVLDAANEFAGQCFGRALSTYEQQEVCSMVLGHCQNGGVPFGEEQRELLQIAFQSAADADVLNLKYLRGVYNRFQERNIFGSGDYYALEAEKDRAAGLI